MPKNTIVLFAPEIPPNTGTIARLCAVTNTNLHLVGTLGFSLEEKYLRRAGLDYWQHICVNHTPDSQQFIEQTLILEQAYLFSSKSNHIYTDVSFESDREYFLCFGNETSGVDQKTMNIFKDRCLKLPMMPEQRCLNLAVSAGIALYEVLRQQGFSALT